MSDSSFAARRRLLTAIAVMPLAVTASPSFAAVPKVFVTKLEGCGCCDEWAAHLRKNGFSVSVRALPDLAPVRRKNRTRDFDTCHTATVEGYVIEGHVPAADIHRLLRAQLKVAGLVVPGMPAGSPGMESSGKEPYDVLTFDRSGTTQVFASYR